MAETSREELPPLLSAYLFKQCFVTSDKRLSLEKFLLTSESVAFPSQRRQNQQLVLPNIVTVLPGVL